uniref:Serine protease 42 n=1 Tax=Aceria tosichella TaxID=561515 RepID=A0A6G1SAF1_9ACAR
MKLQATRHCSVKISLLLAIIQATNATIALNLTTTATLANSSTNSSTQNDTQTLVVDTQRATPATSGRQSMGARAGRMLDLDRLSGEVGKSAAKGPSLSGNRQSRILSDNDEEPRSSSTRKGGQRKMSINGFIPIVSLDSQGTTADEEDNDQQQQQQNLREQLATSYGGQTSIGHASIPSTNEQWQQVGGPAADQSQETARAQRKLLGASSLFSGLLPSASKPLGIGGNYPTSQTLLGYNNPMQQQQQQPQQFITGPMNTPMATTLMEQHQTFSPAPQHQALSPTDCICVPFFQCKNGVISEAQLSKSQLFQQTNQHQHQQYQLNPTGWLGQQHQVPRSLSGGEFGAGARGQQLAPVSSSSSNINQQQFVNDIYDQLRKNIESGNLEQQAAAAALLDERNANQTQTNETEERSLISRRQHQATKCGIMRTCCRLPSSLVGSGSGPQHHHHHHQHQQLAAGRLIGPQGHNHQRQHHALVPSASLARPQFATGGPPQPSASTAAHLVNPQLTDFYQLQASGYNANEQQQQPQQFSPQTSQLQAQLMQQQQQFARPQSLLASQQAPSSGSSFMAGRCGLRQALGISGRVQNFQAQAQGESSAEFGEFPAHAAILKRMSPGDSLFVCSAVLISNQWLATAAHCVRKHRPEELKIRLGEWDVNKDDEFYPFVEANVRELVLHPEFQSNSLINDIALLRLEQPVDAGQMPHVAPACIGQLEEQANFVGQRCWVAGWGKDAFGQQGAFQSVLKKVDLPVVSHQDCEQALKHQTKLGRYFRLHQGNICAGGEQGKDACEGDGGGGLYCVEPQSGLVKAVGLVSWGVGCGQRGVPGVFVSMAHYSRWMESVVAASGEENVYGYMDARTEAGAADAMKGIISERSNQPVQPTNGTITISAEANANANADAQTTSANTTTIAITN